MTLPLAFSREAVEDVDVAYQWYNEQRAGLGEEFLEMEAGAFLVSPPS
jgi:hypothetical protein